jgi:beta-phosphoglucomutase-like phosphatase (HAD superfamily)
MADSFDAVVDRESVVRGKPAPDLYLRACDLLGVDPRRALALEDSVPGLRAARAAGMTVVGVRSSYVVDRLESEADLVVDRLDHLLDPRLAWPAPRAGRGGDWAANPP